MDIKNKEAFESKFKLNAIYERESRIRKNNILEFAETAGIYFNIVTNNAWELWQAAQAQAVPEGFVLVSAKNIKYFSNDGENYEIHDTLAEAKHEAECAIEHFSERLADQLSDPRSDGNFNDVGYGIVLAQSAYSIDHIVTQDDIDNEDYSYEVGTEIMSLFLVEAQEQSHD